jgi:serine/threonine protein kinase
MIEGLGKFRRNIVLKRYKDLSDQAFQILSKDAKQASVLTHANIVQVLDLGQWDSDWTVIMEHVSGLRLSDFIAHSFKHNKRIPDNIIFHIILEILKGIEYAHLRLLENNTPVLLHLNLKPDEILLDPHGTIKIKGFSTISKLSEDSIFCPPETDRDHRSDIWGVGAILQVLLVGMDNFDPQDTYTSAPSSALERIVAQAIHYKPEKRFQSAAAMKEALITQCGGIDLQGAQRLAGFMQPQLADLGKDLFERDVADLPTYVSKTISQKELEEIKKGFAKINEEDNQVSPTDSLSLKRPSFHAKNSNAVIIPILTCTLGIKYDFPANEALIAHVNMPNGVVQELKIQLKAGETRLIMIESITLSK